MAAPLQATFQGSNSLLGGMAQTGPVDDVMLRDPYEVLSVDKGATPQEIKSKCELLHTLPDACQMSEQGLLRRVSLIHVLTRPPGILLLGCSCKVVQGID